MIKKRTLLSIILIFTGCMEKHNYPEIELVKFHQDLSYYYIIFLSDTDFSTRESPNSTGVMYIVLMIKQFMTINISLIILQILI